MNKASLTQWLQRLEQLHPTEIELGLERVATVAGKLELLPLRPAVVTVAGTNGKGSTVAVLEALLNTRGHVTGVFTSPHFLRFNERIRVAGDEASDREITAAFAAIDRARGEISLTYFEFATLAALLVFRARKADIVILEVGLGGRLDAVNIVDPAVAVITSIDLDHQDWLGQSRGEIAVEKAGILRPGVPVVIADADPPVQLLECAARVGASPVLVLGRDFRVVARDGGWSGQLAAEDGVRHLPVQPVGALMPDNICAALQAAQQLGEDFTAEELPALLASAQPKGRRQTQRLWGREYLLDVAHNPAAVGKLLEYIDLTHCKGKILALFSVMADKDVSGMISDAAGVFDGWFLADQPGNARAAPAVDLANLLRGEGQHTISISKNIRQAFRRAQSVMDEGDRLVVFGSFNTVAEVLPLLEKDSHKREAGAGS